MENRIAYTNHKPIEPFKEIVAYEAMWKEKSASFKTLSMKFHQHPGSRPSDFVTESDMEELYPKMRAIIQKTNERYKTQLLINGTLDYPNRLREAVEPLELIYYTGDIGLLETRSVAIVGTRKPSDEGLLRTEKLVKLLVADGFTIASGLAAGIDTQAHTTTIDNGGRTIAVIGTPLDTSYPKENTALQDKIAKEHLLMSQVPFYRYKQQGPFGNRLFFPERNKTMSAITEATVIIEAAETSGTLVQARAALKQGRKLFILESCFHNKDITWPQRFHEKGAIRVRDYDDIVTVLNDKK